MIHGALLEDERAHPRPIARVRGTIGSAHGRKSGNGLGQRVLDRWSDYRKQFVRVMPVDYDRVLKTRAKLRQQGLSPEEAELKAFELKALDELRAGGN